MKLNSIAIQSTAKLKFHVDYFIFSQYQYELSSTPNNDVTQFYQYVRLYYPTPSYIYCLFSNFIQVEYTLKITVIQRPQRI